MPTDVMRNYDWKGRHVGYREGSASVPLDPANSDYQRIQAGLSSGVYRETEPTIDFASKAFNERGQLSGFDTNLGFIPADPSNRLYQILQEALASERVQLNEEAPEASGSMAESLLFVVFFPQPWRGQSGIGTLSGVLESAFPYQSHGGAKVLNLRCRLRNVLDGSPAIEQQYLLEHGIVAHWLGSTRLGAAVLEIEIPVRDLNRLFRGERRLVHPLLKDRIEDSLQMHLVRSGRAPNRGPNLRWLISEAPRYLTRLIATLANTVSRVFSTEYGGNLPGYIQETSLLDSILLVARLQDGSQRLQSWHGRVPSTFSADQLPSLDRTIRTIFDAQQNPTGHLTYVPNRISQMVQSGFGMEALSLLNSYIEFWIRESLSTAVAEDSEAVARVESLQQSQLLELMQKLGASGVSPSLSLPQFIEFLCLAEDVRRLRNNYTHRLELPDKALWQTTDVERQVVEITEKFTDPFWRDTRFGLISDLWRVDPGTRQFLIAQLRPTAPPTNVCAYIKSIIWPR
jgi:hypothetical protein